MGSSGGPLGGPLRGPPSLRRICEKGVAFFATTGSPYGDPDSTREGIWLRQIPSLGTPRMRGLKPPHPRQTKTLKAKGLEQAGWGDVGELPNRSCGADSFGVAEFEKSPIFHNSARPIGLLLGSEVGLSKGGGRQATSFASQRPTEDSRSRRASGHFPRKCPNQRP